MTTQMTSKERLLCALEKGKPDRLPVSVHQWQTYHLEQYLGGISALKAFDRLGMDAQIQYFESMGQFWLTDADFTRFSTPQWRDEAVVLNSDPDNRIVHHTIHTPERTLAYKTAGDRKTTWITEYLIKKDEDINLVCIGIKGAFKLWKDPRTGKIIRELIKTAAKKAVETAEEKAARFAKANAQRALQAEANKAMFRGGAGGSTSGFFPLVSIRPSFICMVMKGHAPGCPKPPRASQEAYLGQLQ